jgi:hypothetical protein
MKPASGRPNRWLAVCEPEMPKYLKPVASVSWAWWAVAPHMPTTGQGPSVSILRNAVLALPWILLWRKRMRRLSLLS